MPNTSVTTDTRGSKALKNETLAMSELPKSALAAAAAANTKKKNILLNLNAGRMLFLATI